MFRNRFTVGSLIAVLLYASPILAQDETLLKRTIEEVAPKYNPATEDGMHRMTQEIAERLTCVDERWGRKSTNGGPISGDTIAYRLGDLTSDGRNTPMKVWDFCQGCGEGGATIRFYAAVYDRIVDQRFRPVSNPDICKKPDDDGGGEGGEGEKPSDLGPLLLKILALMEQMAQGQQQQTESLRQAIIELKAQVERGVKIRFQ